MLSPPTSQNLGSWFSFTPPTLAWRDGSAAGAQGAAPAQWLASQTRCQEVSGSIPVPATACHATLPSIQAGGVSLRWLESHGNRSYLVAASCLLLLLILLAPTALRPSLASVVLVAAVAVVVVAAAVAPAAVVVVVVVVVCSRRLKLSLATTSVLILRPQPNELHKRAALVH